MEQQCANEVKVDSSGCLPSCAGAIITSFSKGNENINLESYIPNMLLAYEKIMKWNPSPPVLKG